MAGLGVAVGVLLIARLVPWAQASWWALGAALAGPLIGLACALGRPPSLAHTAQGVDRLLGLADREATAWELRNVGGAFAVLQRQDALASLRRHSSSAVSLRPSRRTSWAALVAMAVVVILAFLPNPMDQVLAERRELREQIAEAQEAVRQARYELAQSGSRLRVEEREALQEALKALEEHLVQARDKPEALAALSEAERTLQQLREPGQAQALQGIASALGAAPAGASLASALQSGDREALAEAIAALTEPLASLSPQEREALMAALQQAANATAAMGRPSAASGQALPDSLRRVARALGSGDAQATSAALGDLEALLAALQEGAAAERAITGMVSAIGDARASISGMAVASNRGWGTGSSEGTGGGDAGRGNDNGAGGSGNGEGSGSGQGTGSGSGSGSGGTGIGSGGGQGGSAAGNAPGARQGEATGRLGTNGETVFIPSQGQGGLPGATIGSGPGTVPGELRPYNEVIGTYASQARDHIERSPVPEGYKDVVRRYFAELER
ncbi:MAG: hypothetical protein HYY01_10160 [Chloroflexi bacterium]|nr:hypothetical protein [Chloroflexota bacterium]